jgi:hypothetical protein
MSSIGRGDPLTRIQVAWLMYMSQTRGRCSSKHFGLGLSQRTMTNPRLGTQPAGADSTGTYSFKDKIFQLADFFHSFRLLSYFG